MADFRVLLFRQDGSPEGELSKSAGTLLTCTRSEEINGEHSLSLTTERHLEVGTRALTHHADGRWREWVVDEPSETHDTGDHAVGTYHLCWSVQFDLQMVYGKVRELGMLSPATARSAMEAALDGTAMWSVGTCDVTEKASSVVMNTDSSAWDRLTTVVKYWGGEIDAEIAVGNNGVTSRKVALRRHLGSESATRRFEWSHDLTGITRTPDPGPYACRLVPLGNGESEEAADGYTTYDVKLDITTAASFVDSSKGIRHERGTDYIRDTQSEAVFRKADGKGGWEYPEVAVTFGTDDLDELVEMAKEDVLYHTRPGISYSGTVANFSVAGMETDGIGLGDEVQVVDMGFNPDAGLRVQERVLHVEIDEMGVEDAKLDIGRLLPKLERTIATITETIGVGSVGYTAPVWDSSRYEVATPTLSHYTVSTPSSGGVSYNVPSISYDIPDYGSAISDIQGQIADIYSGSAGIDIGTAGHDGIIHQFDGVTMTEGTINFTTVVAEPSVPSTGEEKPSDWGKGNEKAKKVADAAASMTWGSGDGGGGGHSF